MFPHPSALLCGSGAPSTPESVIRAHNILKTSGDPINATLPTGSTAGDTVMIFFAGDWNAATPSGWTAHQNDTGSFINGAIFSKVIDATDVSNGFVTIDLGGSGNLIAALVCFDGPVTVRDTNGLRFGSVGTLSTDSTPQAGDTALWWFGNFGAIGSQSIDRGNELENTGNGGTNSWGILTEEVLASGGVQTANFSANNGFAYWGVAVVHA